MIYCKYDPNSIYVSLNFKQNIFHRPTLPPHTHIGHGHYNKLS